MCELLGFSSYKPITLTEHLRKFGSRGGKTADNPDGWGLATRVNDTWQLQKGAEAAADSERYLTSIQHVHSNLVIAHVRKANPPSACVAENTHPFVRECCGRSWVFAHNGKVPEVTQPNGCCFPKASKPLGVTDSEHAFYYLLDEIASVFNASTDHSIWLQKLASLSASIAAYGQFNFLMSDGDYLIAYGHDRLHHLERIGDDPPLEQSVMVASEPLTDDIWQVFQSGELRVYCNGKLIGNVMTQPVPAPLIDKDDTIQNKRNNA